MVLPCFMFKYTHIYTLYQFFKSRLLEARSNTTITYCSIIRVYFEKPDQNQKPRFKGKVMSEQEKESHIKENL